jgi:hypothetical protein
MAIKSAFTIPKVLFRLTTLVFMRIQAFIMVLSFFIIFLHFFKTVLFITITRPSLLAIVHLPSLFVAQPSTQLYQFSILLWALWIQLSTQLSSQFNIQFFARKLSFRLAKHQYFFAVKHPIFTIIRGQCLFIGNLIISILFIKFPTIYSFHRTISFRF